MFQTGLGTVKRKKKNHAAVRLIIQCKINIPSSTCLRALSRDSSNITVFSVDLVGGRDSSFQSKACTTPESWQCKVFSFGAGFLGGGVWLV